MKKILGITLLAIFAASSAQVAQAQQDSAMVLRWEIKADSVRNATDAFRQRLEQPDSLYSSSITVKEHGSAADVIRLYYAERKNLSTIPCYRVGIFFSNSQTARQEGLAVEQRFKSQYPGIPTYFTYDGTTWLLTVGNCMNMEEFLVLQQTIKRRYPNAYKWQGNIPIAEFLGDGEAAAAEAEARQ